MKEVLRDLIPKEQKRISEFKAKHKDTPIGQVTVDMVNEFFYLFNMNYLYYQIYGGMRGIKGLVYETSVLDANEGIRFRGKTITECQQQLPKAKGGEEPLPEGLFWLLVTSQVPTQQQVSHAKEE